MTIMSMLIALILSTVIALTSGATQRILPPEETKTIPIGKSTVFTCEVDAASAKIQWFNHMKHEITAKTGRVYVELDEESSTKTSWKLYLSPIEAGDAGRYTCTVTLANTPTKLTKHVDLKIFQDITFSHTPNPQHPPINTNALIECQVTGEPAPAVSWRYNQKPVVIGGRYSKTAKGLTVKDITERDNGNYTCRASVDVEGRYDERVITVVVHIPPKITKISYLEGTQGKNGTLQCHASGLPPPRFEFYKDRIAKAIISSDRVFIDIDYGRIHFRPMRKEDNGTYFCKAFNDVGNDTKEGKVRVLVPAKITELKNLTVSEKQSATLICKSEGDPTPTLIFRKDGTNIDYRHGNNDNNHVIIREKPGQLELVIAQPQPTDTANYTCRTNNSVGNDKLTGSIVVLYKPRFVDLRTKVHTWPGRTHNISCAVQAHPPPTFKWLRSGKELHNDIKYHIYNSENVSNLQVRLRISDHDFEGQYECQATNSQGTSSHGMTVVKAGAPGQPVNVNVKDSSTNMIVLTVEHPKDNGGVDIIGFRVEYENKIQDFATGFPNGYYLPLPGGSLPEQDRRTSTGQPKVKVEELRIENLRPKTLYSFQIRAKNEVGVGKHYQYNASTTDIDKPSPIEIISHKQGTEAYAYNVVWATPKTGGKPIKQYEIKYRKMNGQTAAEDWRPIVTLDNPHNPVTQFHLLNLDPLTSYGVMIRAENEKGWSDPGASFVFKTSEVRPLASHSSSAGIPNKHGVTATSRILLLLLSTIFICATTTTTTCLWTV